MMRIIFDKNIFFIIIKSRIKCFFPSPFNEAVVLTADGVGEWATTTVAVGKGINLKLKRNTFYIH